MNELQKDYNKIVDRYVHAFEKKQGFHIEYWVADRIGGVCCMGDHYFEFIDIRYDIDHDIEAGVILEWLEHNLYTPQQVTYPRWRRLMHPDNLIATSQLPNYVKNAISKNTDYKTLTELKGIHPDDLLSIRGISGKTVTQIINYLMSHNDSLMSRIKQTQ